MAKTIESLDAFYRYKFKEHFEHLKKDQKQFNVFRIEDRIRSGEAAPEFIRRDFFKIMLFQGEGVFYFRDERVPVKGNTLLFFHPHMPYTYEPLKPGTGGYFCIFKTTFLEGMLRLNLNDLPLFSDGTLPVFSLSGQQAKPIKHCFEKMIAEVQSDYLYKYELVKNYVIELVYAAMKLLPPQNLLLQQDAASRMTTLFFELLDHQFPVSLTSGRFELRAPQDIADRLAVHVNYLNRVLKQTTGKTTSAHLAERLAAEAGALLRHTHGNIAEIAYVLGFDDPAHFTRFFRKQTGLAPSAFREV